MHSFTPAMLNEGESAVRRLEIRLRNVSNIAKVVWSSFDFMCGPELKFVWEVIPSNSVSPLNLSSGEGSINGEGSLVSSMSTQSAQYEDIDDPLQVNITYVLSTRAFTPFMAFTAHRSCSLALTTSCVDSGIGGTISTHSELSGFCLSPLAESLPDAPTTSFQPFKDPNLQVGFFFSCRFHLPFVRCSAQLPSNPLMHKMTVVPSRNLLVGSFIFSMSQPDGIRTLYAISFLMNNCKLEWYMERQTFVESVVLDIIPKLKALFLSKEPWEDVVVRANLDLTRMVNLISILDRYPLVSELCPLLIKNTLLVQKRCQDDKILSKAISGVLQSQGQCVIIGSDTQYVCRLLHTLAAFLPIELRWCCPRMYRHKFSPYVRLQAVHRHELPNVMQCGALANWPLCVVDVDRSMVCMSAHYSRHRVLKQRADAQRIDTILNNVFQNKPVTLELSSCRILECVKAFVRRMDMLPVEEKRQILYYFNFQQSARMALIVYVKHASEPLPSEKSSATKSSRFSLNECRCALDLQSDSWFHAVLARAELIMPDIAEFIYSST
uniref:Folliculin n=1 Tax=Angiostrongylus cantonensis TaxID=6313 RepID=A0A158P9F7_ANGCA